jgi:hypothetical protein
VNAHSVASSDTPLPQPTPRPPRDGPATWTQRWLDAGSSSWAREGQRLLLAMGLASLFGVALGLRRGQAYILLGALGAPAGIAAVAAVAVPAFAIVLALANAPVDVMDLARATTRAAFRAGLLLAGLAPGVALLVVSCEDAITVTVTGFGSLLLAGALASRAFADGLRPQLEGAPRSTRAVMAVAMPLFLVFAAVLAARVWWLALPWLTEVA